MTLITTSLEIEAPADTVCGHLLIWEVTHTVQCGCVVRLCVVPELEPALPVRGSTELAAAARVNGRYRHGVRT